MHERRAYNRLDSYRLAYVLCSALRFSSCKCDSLTANLSAVYDTKMELYLMKIAYIVYLLLRR